MGSVGAGSVSDIHLSCLVLFLKAYNGPSNAQSQPHCRIVFCCTATSGVVPPSFLSLGSSLLLASLFSVWSLPWHEGTGAATYLDSLAPLCCGERTTLQTLLARVGRPGSGWSPHQLPQPKALPLPGSQVGLEDTVPQWPCVRSGSWYWVVTFSVDVNWPRSQEDMVSSKRPLIAWEEVQSLGPRLQQPLAFHLWLLPTFLSPSVESQKRQMSCSPLVSLGCNPLFCEHTNGHSTALEPFCREGLFFYFVSLAFPWFGFSPFCPCCVTSVPSECRHGIQPPVLSLRTDDAACTSVLSPHSLRVDASVWATSQIAIWHSFCVFCLFGWLVGYTAICDSKAPHSPACERSCCCVETSPLKIPSPG